MGRSEALEGQSSPRQPVAGCHMLVGRLVFNHSALQEKITGALLGNQ